MEFLPEKILDDLFGPDEEPISLQPGQYGHRNNDIILRALSTNLTDTGEYIDPLTGISVRPFTARGINVYVVGDVTVNASDLNWPLNLDP